MGRGAVLYPDEPDAIRREPEHIARARRTKAARSPGRPIAPFVASSTPRPVPSLKPRPHLRAQIRSLFPGLQPRVEHWPVDHSSRLEVHEYDPAHIPLFLRFDRTRRKNPAPPSR